MIRFRTSVFLFASLWVVCTALAVNYPLKLAGPNSRQLVDRNNQPFLINGDCAWALIVTPNQAGVEQYLEDRRLKGFNTIVVMLIANHSTINGHFTANSYGVYPFTVTNDFTTPNEAYFANADFVIQRAAQKGLQILLAPCYVGYDTLQGWQLEMVANGTNNCRAYGRFLGQRYKDIPNIIWLHSGDNGDPAYFPYIREIALGIREFDTNHLHTAKLWPEQSARDLLGNESWLDFNTTYAYGLDNFFNRRVADKTLEDYNGLPVMPTILVESTFELEHNADSYIVRRQSYWSVLCGSTGQIIGNRDIWPFFLGWPNQLDSPASVQMMHLQRLFESRPWHMMIPDQDHSAVTSGYGLPFNDNYLAAMRATNGVSMIAYVPTPRTFTVDLGKIIGTQAKKAWWFNPRTGGATNFANFSGSGFQEITTPDTNDWVFVLDSGSVAFDPPGNGPDPLKIVTSWIPHLLVNEPCSIQFEASGGSPPYSWSPVSPLPPGLAFSGAGLLSGTPTVLATHDITLKVNDSAGRSTLQLLKFKVAAADQTSPTTPSQLSAIIVEKNSIGLTWTASTDNTGVAAYRVERTNPDGTNFVEIATVSGTNFTDTGLFSGTEYTYRVRANDAASNFSGYSPVLEVMTDGAAPLPTGPVAAFNFNEGAGSMASDISGHGNHGLIDGADWVDPGKISTALAFDGADWLTVNDSASLDLTNAMTLEAWVSPSIVKGDWTTIIIKESNDNQVYMLQLDPLNRPSLYVSTTAGVNGIVATDSIPTNAWTHLAGVYDGAALRLYVNGTESAQTLMSGQILASPFPLRIGGNTIWGGRFVGRLDELRIYNYALTPAAVQSDMAVPIGFPSVMLTAPGQTATEIRESGFRVLISSSAPFSFALESTTNGIFWQHLGSVFYSNSPVMVSDTNASPSQRRFYRLR